MLRCLVTGILLAKNVVALQELDEEDLMNAESEDYEEDAVADDNHDEHHTLLEEEEAEEEKGNLADEDLDEEEEVEDEEDDEDDDEDDDNPDEHHALLEEEEEEKGNLADEDLDEEEEVEDEKEDDEAEDDDEEEDSEDTNFAGLSFVEATADKQAVFAEAKKQHKPAMVIVSKSSCPHCVDLGTSMKADKAMPELMAKFATFHVGGGAGESWGNEGYVPRTYFYTEDGKQLDVHSPHTQFPYFFWKSNILATGMKKALTMQ